ncbi:hypothetical protein MJO28_004562 [Puccinia striiformis f. sp. tritici]|uniref:Uncharacterized protein n=1 Tax=Puccinia striiformis f. sp. tritici TaxID=168172 RepID=A0ACC0EPE8_9BASI|nr:hypothetical protein MJO28_004562 [Puccinia striiformis f. sp. tritici]
MAASLPRVPTTAIIHQRIYQPSIQNATILRRHYQGNNVGTLALARRTVKKATQVADARDQQRLQPT